MANDTHPGPIWAPRLLSIFRIVVGLLFLSHGIAKLFGFPAGAQPNSVPLFSLFGLAGMLELVGGAAIMLGLFTRPAAFLLSGEMAIAYFMMHMPQSMFPRDQREDSSEVANALPILARATGPVTVPPSASTAKIRSA